jgi:HECT-domain (ubiquitin-transferase)
MFNQQELQALLGGVNTPIDIEDLRRNTNYGGLYDEQEPTIVTFWRVRPQTGEACITDRHLSLTCPIPFLYRS